MAKFQISAPDGSSYEITAPDGATEEQVLAYAQQNFQAPAQQSEQQVTPSAGDALKRSAGLTTRAAVQGVLSPVTQGLDIAAVAQEVNPRTGLISPGISAAYQAAKMLTGSTKTPQYSKAVSEGLTQMGAPTPETLPEKAAAGGIEAMTGFGALASKGTTAYETLKNLVATTTGGAVAKPVAEVVTQETGNPLAGEAAALMASVVAGGAAGKGVQAWNSPKTLSIPEVKARAAANYAKMDEQGVTIKPKSVLDMVDNVEKQLLESNYVPKTDTKVGNTLEMFREIVGTERVPFNKVEKLRSLATTLSNDSDANTRRLGKVLVEGVDNYIHNINGKDIIAGKDGIDKAVQAVMNARKDWRSASKAQAVQDVFDVAQIRAEKPDVSEANAIRNQLTNLLANKNKRNMFTEAEQNAMKAVVNGGPIDALASLVGRFNPMRPFGAAGAGGAAMGTGDPMIGAAVGGAGFLTDVTQGAMKRRAMNNLVRSIASGTVREEPNTWPAGLMGGILGGQQ